MQNQSNHSILPLGSRVRVNHFDGHIRNYFTEATTHDKQTGNRIRVSLHNPLYEVEIDLNRRQSWVREARQVHIPPGKHRMLLFRDEFDLLKISDTECNSRILLSARKSAA